MFKFINLVYVPALTNKICDAKVTQKGLVASIIPGIEVPIWLDQKQEDNTVQAFKVDIINYYNLVKTYPELEKPKHYDVVFSYETTKSVGENSFYRLLLILTKTSAIMSRTYVDNGTSSTVTKQVNIDIAKVRKDGVKFETLDKKSNILCTEIGFTCLVEGLYFDVPLTNAQHDCLKKLSLIDNKTILFKQSVLVPLSLIDKAYYEYIMTMYPNKILIEQNTIDVNNMQKAAVEFDIDFNLFIDGKQKAVNGKSFVEQSSEGFLVRFENNYVSIPVSRAAVDYLKTLESLT